MHCGAQKTSAFDLQPLYNAKLFFKQQTYNSGSSAVFHSETRMAHVSYNNWLYIVSYIKVVLP